MKFVEYNDELGYDYYWNDLTAWEFDFKYNFTDKFIDEIIEEHDERSLEKDMVWRS